MGAEQEDLAGGADELAGLLIVSRPRLRRRAWGWRGWRPGLGAVEPFYHPELVDTDYWIDRRVESGVAARPGKDAVQMDGSIIFSDGSRSPPDLHGDPPGYWAWGVAYEEGPIVQPDRSVIYPDGSRSYPNRPTRDPSGSWPRGGHTTTTAMRPR